MTIYLNMKKYLLNVVIFFYKITCKIIYKIILDIRTGIISYSAMLSTSTRLMTDDEMANSDVIKYTIILIPRLSAI